MLSNRKPGLTVVFFYCVRGGERGLNNIHLFAFFFFCIPSPFVFSHSSLCCVFFFFLLCSGDRVFEAVHPSKKKKYVTFLHLFFHLPFFFFFLQSPFLRERICVLWCVFRGRAFVRVFVVHPKLQNGYFSFFFFVKKKCYQFLVHCLPFISSKQGPVEKWCTIFFLGGGGSF